MPLSLKTDRTISLGAVSLVANTTSYNPIVTAVKKFRSLYGVAATSSISEIRISEKDELLAIQAGMLDPSKRIGNTWCNVQICPGNTHTCKVEVSPNHTGAPSFFDSRGELIRT